VREFRVRSTVPVGGGRSPLALANLTMRTKLTEVSLVLAIILVVAFPVLRLIYGQSVRQWEHQTLERLGISPDLVWMLCGVVGVTIGILLFRRRDR